jgi:capsular polysaccharide export protein
MILTPLWYDPCRDRLCDLETVIDQLEAETKAYRQDHAGYVALGISQWKRPHFQRFFGQERRLTFIDRPDLAVRTANAARQPVLVWGMRDTQALKGAQILRVEDGFVRSRGLGADLVPPLSLITDGLGIYYDSDRPSLFGVLMRLNLSNDARARSLRLIDRLRATGLSKYNPDALPLPPLPPGHRILVPGQVEDDASIRLGAGDIRTNLGLLRATRAANPDAVILYKPHPDVVAGLRPGAVDAGGLADLVIPDADPVALIAAVDEVWTMTSTLGFEALIRGRPVTCTGMPFYAGWGLTRDLAPLPPFRQAQPPCDLAKLVHTALIAYSRYHDPVTNLPCPPEVIVDRLVSGVALPMGNRMLSKLQGRLASQSWLWRR